MIEGESGLKAKSPPHLYPRYITSQKLLRWKTGQESHIFTSDEPDGSRGHQHQKVWADELAAWHSFEPWDNLKMGLRIGTNPQICVTTTPRRLKLLRQILAKANTAVTRGRTVDNAANLAAEALEELLDSYANTELGRQELDGELLDDCEGAYWDQELINELRILEKNLPPLVRVVIGVDPAITNNSRSDHVGIVVVGLGIDGHVYVLADLSCKASPGQWASLIIKAYREFGADKCIVETNRGGDLLAHTLRIMDADAILNIDEINSQEDKPGRAEPVSALYSQKVRRAHHVGTMKLLEDEMTDWDPRISKYSPNRIDALVFAVVELIPNLRPSRPISQRVDPRKEIYLPARKSVWTPSKGPGRFWQALSALGFAA